MRRMILLAAVALVMAMVVAGPAHAEVTQSIGSGGNSIGNFGSSNGFSNTDSVILVGNSAFFFTPNFGIDLDDNFGGIDLD